MAQLLTVPVAIQQDLAAVAVRPCSSIEQFIAQKYDYLIVGGGTAGLVLAARLTENPKVHVAVVEAGKNRMEDMQTLVPALFTKLLSNPDYDWMHTTALQVCL
jgi:choline dehydrogenase-like flavoprotein